MADFSQAGEPRGAWRAMTREEYDELDDAGLITRPLTWGPQRRRLARHDLDSGGGHSTQQAAPT